MTYLQIFVFRNRSKTNVFELINSIGACFISIYNWTIMTYQYQINPSCTPYSYDIEECRSRAFAKGIIPFWKGLGTTTTYNPPPKMKKKIDLLNIITRVTVSKYSSKLCRAVCYHLYLLHLYLFLNWWHRYRVLVFI